MRFRYARHTNDLPSIIKFYTTIVGMQLLGSFEQHGDYDGVFLGFKEKDWHLEFTTSSDIVDHQPDDDDLLIFYLESNEILQTIKDAALKNHVRIRQSKNPYWQLNGVELEDPDGYGVILTVIKK